MVEYANAWKLDWDIFQKYRGEKKGELSWENRRSLVSDLERNVGMPEYGELNHSIAGKFAILDYPENCNPFSSTVLREGYERGRRHKKLGLQSREYDLDLDQGDLDTDRAGRMIGCRSITRSEVNEWHSADARIGIRHAQAMEKQGQMLLLSAYPERWDLDESQVLAEIAGMGEVTRFELLIQHEHVPEIITKLRARLEEWECEKATSFAREFGMEVHEARGVLEAKEQVIDSLPLPQRIAVRQLERREAFISTAVEHADFFAIHTRYARSLKS